MPFVFAQACVPAVPVWGEKDRYFPVHRVYAIAGNYADHLAEMGRVERAEPVFFTKPSDGLVVCKEGKSVEIPYPRETNSFCLGWNSSLRSAKQHLKLVSFRLKKQKNIFSVTLQASSSRAAIFKQSLERTANLGKRQSALTTQH